MFNAVVVEAVRTPLGKRGGQLKDVHPVDLAADALRAVVERAGIDPALVEDVIMGCVMQTGEQGFNIARNASLAAGFPESVVGTTIDRQCGSSQQSAHFAAQGVMAGAYDVVIAAGIESMSRVPMGITAVNGPGVPFGPKMQDRYEHNLVPQGISAQMVADKWGVSRTEMDQIATDSHARALQAQEEGRFDTQIVPVEVHGEMVGRDEGIRPGTNLEKLATLSPAFNPEHDITAGNASQITDGAVAILIMSETKALELGLKPLVRFKAFSLAGDDPIMMLSAPMAATQKALDRADLTIDDIGLFEINEAFASVPGAWLKEFGGADPDALWEKTNVNGGAIALGHPLGASGGRLMTTLIHEMVRSGTKYGLQSMCEGGGMANGTILELV
jgi:acetyl-CoA acyltransferase